MKQLAARMARVKILTSWVDYSSRALIPSVSITMMFTDSPSRDTPFKGVPQHHRPLVQAFTVEPTLKPLLLFSSILFRR